MKSFVIPIARMSPARRVRTNRGVRSQARAAAAISLAPGIALRACVGERHRAPWTAALQQAPPICRAASSTWIIATLATLAQTAAEQG